MSRFKMIQMTNLIVGQVAENTTIPLGTVTRGIDCKQNNATFGVASSTNDTVVLNDAGYYKVTYSISAVAENTGINGISLLVNGTALYFVEGSVATAGDTINLTLPYYVKVLPKCVAQTNNPVSIQVRAESAITSASAVLIIEKMY